MGQILEANFPFNELGTLTLENQEKATAWDPFAISLINSAANLVPIQNGQDRIGMCYKAAGKSETDS